ncbi:MAG: proton-conducting transporter membrane subunit [Planctomycetaceae bacterium]
MAASIMFLILPAMLVASVYLPNGWANSHASLTRRLVTRVAGIQSIIAAVLAIGQAAGWLPSPFIVHLDLVAEPPGAAAVYFDGVAGLMLTLVSFVGWVVCQYSVRYLDGEATQGRYFRWIGFTIGAVSLMVISGNLLMFMVAWVMTSLGLHQLLLHYGHRPAARRAAWTKFAMSRLGDVALMAATVIIYGQFGTLDFAELFALAGSLTGSPPATQVASFLLVLGAITKSAQFPFHSWLPQTMETPTPVSALMHAGIVNAGGYLMIRTSPLVAITPWALTTLALIGGVTACLGAVVMMTQTSIKKSLAYSTIAQMGFMLLQCGVGAYSAAMLHILAHSLYKAHAFLGSGSVLTDRSAARESRPLASQYGGIKLTTVAIVACTFLGMAFTLSGVNPTTKPAGLLLVGVLCLALTNWVGQAMRRGNPSLWILTGTAAAGLCLVYTACFVVIDNIVAPSLPATSVPAALWLVVGLVGACFVGMFALQAGLASGREITFLYRCRIHAANGFYVESFIRRLFGPAVHAAPE